MKNAAYTWGLVTTSEEWHVSFSEVGLSLLAGRVIFVHFEENSLQKVWT